MLTTVATLGIELRNARIHTRSFATLGIALRNARIHTRSYFILALHLEMLGYIHGDYHVPTVPPNIRSITAIANM